jgi:hypothetical protein
VFDSFHRYLGVAVGECLGYLLTGVWTLLVAIAMLQSSSFGDWLAWPGMRSACSTSSARRNGHGGRWWTLRGRRTQCPPPAQTTATRAEQAKSRSPLTDSNRRPPPYHEREEGVDSCGFAPSAAAFRVSRVVAVRRVLQARATWVRPRPRPEVWPSCSASAIIKRLPVSWNPR